MHGHFCPRTERRKARYAKELSRAASARKAGALEEVWGDETTDEDDLEIARHTRERNQITEVRCDCGERDSYGAPLL